jgi:glycerol-3-phosphate dehydrogenase (NAD(P)+)
MGAHPETFSGLSGMGDLIVTCTSRHSRNRAVGERLGRGETIEQIMQGLQMVAEGVVNGPIALELARKLAVEAPIIEQVQAIIEQIRPPIEAVGALMQRDMKPED